MSTPTIERSQVRQLNVSVATAVANSTLIPMEAFAGGIVEIPSASSIQTLTYYVATAGDVQITPTLQPLADRTNTAVTQVVTAGQSYPLPDECFGAGGIAMIGNAAGTVNVSKKG